MRKLFKKFKKTLKPDWIGLDETTDVDSQYIANVMVGKCNTERFKPFLL